jgi:hypothetical protein
VLADPSALPGACLLVEAEVDAAVYASVVDVVGELPQAGVREDLAR